MRSHSDQPHIPGEAGIWIFIFGDMAIFAVLFGTYMHYRSHDRQLFNESQKALDTTFGVVNTVLLLLSSLLVALAISAVRRTITGIASVLIIGAMGCGVAFSVLKVVEYTREISHGKTPQTNDFFMFYYILTGLHWFHLMLGMIALTFLFISSRRVALTARQYSWVEGSGCFWHMVDLLWIMVFPLLYLVS